MSTPHSIYSAAVGRWVSRDPIGEQGALNLYGFVDPVNYVDLKGLKAKDWIWPITKEVIKILPWVPPGVGDIVDPPSLGGPYVPGSCRLTSASYRTIKDWDTNCCIKKQCLYAYFCRSGHYSDEVGDTCEYTVSTEVGCDERCTNVNNSPSYEACVAASSE